MMDMIQSRIELAELASEGLDVGTILLARRTVRAQVLGEERAVTRVPPPTELTRARVALEHLEKTFVRPILEAPTANATIELARTLSQGFLQVFLEFFVEFFNWLNADPSQRERFLSDTQAFLDQGGALRDLGLDSKTPGLRDTERCLQAMSRLLDLVPWLEKAHLDEAALNRLIAVASLSDLLALAAVVGLEDANLRARAVFPVVARTAWEYFVERYVLVLEGTVAMLPPGVRQDYVTTTVAAAETRLERLAREGFSISGDPKAKLMIGDPLLGGYYEHVFKSAVGHFPGATLVVDFLDDPESEEGARPVLRIRARHAGSVEETLEARARFRADVRSILPNVMSSRLGVDIQL